MKLKIIVPGSLEPGKLGSSPAWKNGFFEAFELDNQGYEMTIGAVLYEPGGRIPKYFGIVVPQFVYRIFAPLTPSN